jgi:hypothetical protein
MPAHIFENFLNCESQDGMRRADDPLFTRRRAGQIRCGDWLHSVRRMP